MTSTQRTTPPTTYRPVTPVAAHFNLPMKTAVLLHPRRAIVLDKFCSKIGGQFAWPDQEPWPKCSQHEVPFVPIAQLRRSDVPELPFPARSDLFQLLWCPEDHVVDEQCGPDITVRWRTCEDILSPRMEAPTPSRVFQNRRQVPKECAIHPERIAETPPYNAVIETETIDIWLQQNAQPDFEATKLPAEYQEDTYISQFSAAPSSKVGGYASYVLEEDSEQPTCERCETDMELLITVSSTDIGDGCSGYRWAPSDVGRREDGMWENMCEKGTGLVVGRCGSAYVFICTNCASMPTELVLM